MSENRSLNSLFARLDESKANRANEANREHEKAAEEAEKERQKKKVEESAVEKYRVYDDDYEPEVMIPKGNPGAVQQPAKPKKEKKGTKEQEMDEITDGAAITAICTLSLSQSSPSFRMGKTGFSFLNGSSSKFTASNPATIRNPHSENPS